MTIRPTIWLNDFIVRGNLNPLLPLSDPQIVALTNGNFLVSWTDRTNLADTAPGSDILGQLYDPLGVAIGGPIRLNTNNADNESQADIAALPNGGFVIVYLDPNGSGDTVRWNIRSATGALVSNGTVFTEGGVLELQGDPEVVVAPNGSFAVAWTTRDTSPVLVDFDFTELQFFQPDGSASNFPNTIFQKFHNGHDISIDAQGNYLAAGSYNGGITVPSQVIVERFAQSALQTPAGPLAIIDAAAGVLFSEVRIAGLRSTTALPSLERFVVVFTSDSGSRDDIVFSIFDAERRLVNQRFVTLDGETDNEASVVALPDGGFFIVWDDDTNNRLEGQRFNAAGDTVGAQLLLATGSVSAPELTLTTDGRILVAWSEAGQIRTMILDPRLNVITGTALNDVLTAPTENSTVNGLAGADKLFGSLFNDTLDGGTGNDTLFGRDGNDRLSGGDGHDTLSGGNGNDTLSGGAGNDTVLGDIGNDIFVGDAGNDIYQGGDGLDTLDYRTSTAGLTVNLLFSRGSNGLAAGDTYSLVEGAFGSAFDDFLFGNFVANAFSGGDGNDVLFGFAGNDTLFGGFGNDTLNGGSGADTLAGSVGQDEVSYAGALSAVTLNLTNGVRGGDAVGDVLSSIEVVRGSSRDDLLTGGTTAITLLGEAGNDILTLGTGGGLLFGGAGNDTLTGTAGNDTLEGGAGGDTLVGGDGVDEASYASSGAAVLVNLSLPGFAFGDAINDQLFSIESIRGSVFNDELQLGPAAGQIHAGAGDDTLRDGTGADQLFGEAGNDTLSGGVGADTLFGGDGNDRLILTDDTLFADGGAGDDTLLGSSGNDSLIGGDGNDVFVISNAGDTIVENTGQGVADRVITSVGFALAADDFVEFLQTSNAAGTTALNLAGNALSQIITGNAGSNDLNGGAGLADTLIGLGGDDFYRVFNSFDRVIEDLGGGTNDRVAVAVSYELDKFDDIEVLSTLNAAGTVAINLAGNGISQRIIGNAGDNVISGRGGNDTLVGGAGADTFVFFGNYGPDNNDRINDYTVSDDLILFDATDSSILAAGALSAAAFVSNLTGLAGDSTDRIIYQSNTGKLFFDTDGAGGVAAVLFAQITPNLVMTAAEFDIFIAT